MKSANDLEKEFDIFFETIGFRRVTDIIGLTPNFKNADYVHLNNNSIVELKIVDKDFFKDGGTIDSFHSFIAIPQNVDENGFGIYKWKLSDVNREGKHDTFEEPLRRIIKKANRQIRETKEHLFSGDGFGFLFIVLNWPTQINPEIIRELICKLLGEEFTSISGFILCSLYDPVCFPMTPYGCPDFVADECFNIGKAWCDFFNEGCHLSD